MKILLSIIAVVFASNCLIVAQTNTDTSKKYPAIIWGDIHAGFYHDFNNRISPQTAFQFTTGLIGYKKSLSDKVKATIIYDVTRTTNFIFPDTIGIQNYFEGSKYTAFLKMAQIDWRAKPWLELSIGQLLNEQYLTLQDKHWGFRYIATTFQELYRYGNPADFGFRAKFFPESKMQMSVNIFNGEGPFRYQDSESRFLFAINAEYRPWKEWIFKAYADFQQKPSSGENNRIVLSGFAGYKNEKTMFGFEYNTILNNAYLSGVNYSGASFYASRALNTKLSLLSRADYLISSSGIENGLYVILGAEYRPVKSFGVALNLKRNTWMNYYQLCLNAGIRF